MGRENSEPTVVMHSSIALLQERFRQLQRVKEMREERELLKLFSESERLSPTICCETTRQFFHTESTIHPQTSKHSSLSYFHPESQEGKYGHSQAVNTPLLMSLWPTDRSIVRASNTLDDAEVDTTLHL
ncbi:hypothetical protein AQUCO_00500250v1 [Aquilegia coerulea]|uniref:Uncharacterized protein n=1 Tax=Aquilegia coerulea TaxID=218851 RepID=A0A2G5ER18_AQUCA|nr:hypothetical protein AQUCO_00500250v1 [Aquilegia coerulea]